MSQRFSRYLEGVSLLLYYLLRWVPCSSASFDCVFSSMLVTSQYQTMKLIDGNRRARASFEGFFSPLSNHTRSIVEFNCEINTKAKNSTF